MGVFIIIPCCKAIWVMNTQKCGEPTSSIDTIANCMEKHLKYFHWKKKETSKLHYTGNKLEHSERKEREAKSVL